MLGTLIHKNKNRGFSLVELMVAMTLSLVLMAGVIKIYANNKASQKIQSVVNELQENQQTALAFLTREIRSAGFSTIPGQITIFDTAQTSDGGVDGSGDALSDTISLRRQSSSDCMGANTGGSTTNTYYINASQSLMCRGSGNPVAQPIAEGVENMQILYGIDTDPIIPGAIRSANAYLDADDVADFSNVVSVRITLLLSSQESVNSQAFAGNFDLLGNTFTPAADTSRFRRHVITTTVLLRNSA